MLRNGTKTSAISRLNQINYRNTAAALENRMENRNYGYQEQRRNFISKALYKASKSVMPPISKTEQIALGCGTIGFDR